MGATWIAKPLSSLSRADVDLWSSLNFDPLPLSQTIAWGNAIAAIHGNTWLVFSAEKKVSALFIVSEHEAECVNGPILNWSKIQSAQDLNEQVSMVVYALVQSNPKITAIRLRPRLEEAQYQFLTSNLAFPFDRTDKARTSVIKLQNDHSLMWEKLPGRIRHEIKRTSKAGIQIQNHSSLESLRTFWKKTSEFYQARSLFIPDQNWIEAFLDPSLAHACKWNIISISHPESQSISEILIVHYSKTSFYFYAHEFRTERCPNISLNSVAQWEAMKCARESGSLTYDLNGILHPDQSLEEGDSYFGVDQYKRKFKGREINYFSPLIRFGET